MSTYNNGWILLNVETMPKILHYLLMLKLLLSNIRFSASFRRLEESTHYNQCTGGFLKSRNLLTIVRLIFFGPKIFDFKMKLEQFPATVRSLTVFDRSKYHIRHSFLKSTLLKFNSTSITYLIYQSINELFK